MLVGWDEAALTAGVAGALWALSVSSWVVIAYKTWWVWRAAQDLSPAQQAFWQATDPVQAHQALALLDRQAVLHPLAGPVCSLLAPPHSALGRSASERQACQRQVVQSLRGVAQRIQWGQSWLACVASVAPFLGLLGTVWGLLGALTALPSSPEAWGDWVPALSQTLHLTAIGLCVAVPALLAHQLLAPRLLAVQQSIEDFAADLIEHLQAGQPA
jgi:biopolymer transport protein ExbB